MTRVQVCFIKPVRCCYTCGRRQLCSSSIITGFQILTLVGLTVVSHIAKGDYYVVSWMQRGLLYDLVTCVRTGERGCSSKGSLCFAPQNN